MKTMCLPSYHHNGFVATHALGQVQVHHVPKCMSCHKATHLASVRFEHSVCHGSLMTTYVYIYIYIYILYVYILFLFPLPLFSIYSTLFKVFQTVPSTLMQTTPLLS